MQWLFVIILSLCAVELFIRVPLLTTARKLIATITKSTRIIRSPKISDCWKEKAVLQYSKLTFINTIWLLVYFAFIALCLIIITLLGDYLSSGFTEYMLSVNGILVTTLIAIGYVFLRRKIVSPK